VGRSPRSATKITPLIRDRCPRGDVTGRRHPLSGVVTTSGSPGVGQIARPACSRTVRCRCPPPQRPHIRLLAVRLKMARHRETRGRQQLPLFRGNSPTSGLQVSVDQCWSPRARTYRRRGPRSEEDGAPEPRPARTQPARAVTKPLRSLHPNVRRRGRHPRSRPVFRRSRITEIRPDVVR